MRRILETLPAGWPYVASIALTKGFSLIAIPLIANFIEPSEYGRLDVAASFMEFLGIVFAMGLADTLIRFTSMEKEEAKRKNVAGQIIGTGIMLAIVLGVVVQFFVPLFLDTMPIPFGEGAIRAGFLAATLAGLIALPLAWVRLKDQPLLFLLYTGTRGFLQAVATITVAWAGYSVETILYTNAAVDIVISTVVLGIMVKETGVTFKLEAFKRTLNYGLPLVGGSLAMFVLGACDRWFLASAVPTSSLAHYAVATKLALAAPLLMQPFGLWWYAQRLRVLEEPDGLQKSADIIGMGFTILLVSAAAISLAGPLFIHLTMPEEYMQATRYLPWLIGITVLNESNSLLNVGVYRKNHGFLVLMINSICAAIALIGYWLFVPEYGIVGAIAVTILAQSVRLVLFVIIGQRSAPIPYPFVRTGMLAILATFIIWIAPGVFSSLALVSWFIAGMAALAAASIMLGLAKITVPRPGRVVRHSGIKDTVPTQAAE